MILLLHVQCCIKCVCADAMQYNAMFEVESHSNLVECRVNNKILQSEDCKETVKKIHNGKNLVNEDRIAHA